MVKNEIDNFASGALMPVLHEVHGVYETSKQAVYRLDISITDAFDDTYRTMYLSSPDDPHGLNPTLRQWLNDNPDTPRAAYVPPTADQLRAAMPAITARQLRLTLVRNGHSLAGVTAAIDALPIGEQKDEAVIEWEYAGEFQRLNPTLLLIGEALGLTAEQIDAMWEHASSL